MFRIFSNQPLSDLSLDELKRQEESSRTLYRWSIGFALVMIFLVAFWTGLKGYHPSNLIFLLAPCFLPAIVADKRKKIRTEVNARV